MDNDGRFDFGDLDTPDFELAMSLREIADIFCRAADVMTLEEKACVRQVLTWQLLNKCEWTPGDLEFLAEAGIQP